MFFCGIHLLFSFPLKEYIPLWCSGSSLLAISRVGRLGSVPWLRAVRLGGCWSSSSRSAVIATGSITLG